MVGAWNKICGVFSSILDYFPWWFNVHLVPTIDVSCMGVLPSQAPPVLKQIPHSMLWLVRNLVFDGYGWREGLASGNWPSSIWCQRGKSGLLLCMLQSVFHSGHYIVLDSGFCVLKALIALKKKGVFAAALKKNEGFGITMSQASLFFNIFPREGSWNCWRHLWSPQSNQIHHLVLKEPDYVMQIMATGGTLLTWEGRRSSVSFLQKERHEQWVLNTPSHLNIIGWPH